MTSSLVGSEMCIRDRVRGRVSTVSICRATSASVSAPATGSPTRTQTLNRCLLYTSDAADDM
eukprot:4968573-Prorocentrum_lima.AAC.1